MHIQSMVHALDEEVFRLMECQITDIENKRYGGYLMPSFHVEPRMSGFAFSRLVLAYVCKESSHYLSGKVEQAIRANLRICNRISVRMAALTCPGAILHLRRTQPL